MFEAAKRYLRYTSWPIIAAMIALLAIGITAIHVAEAADSTTSGRAARQMVLAGVALAVFVAMTAVPYPRFGQLAYPLFAGTLLLLLVVLFLPERRGAHRWIGVGLAAFQPSELAKLSFILALAWYLRYRENYRRLRGLVLPFVLTFVPMGLILVEPDLGTSLLFLPTLYFMLFMAGAKLRHLLGIVAFGTALLLLPVPGRIPGGAGRGEIARRTVLAYGTVRSGGAGYVLRAAPLEAMESMGNRHQIRRILGWLRQADPRLSAGAGYQLHQSKMVLGSGMLSGSGDWQGADVFFPMLPDDHTDFIFSVIGGQWGFLGCAGVLGLYVVIFVFGIEIASITHDPFGRLLAVGVLGMLFSQVFINVGMTMGLMPITGMTLPLVSYGGSSLVVNCAAIGLLVNVGQRRPITLARRPFEHGNRPARPAARYGLLAGAPQARRSAPRPSKAEKNTTAT